MSRAILVSKHDTQRTCSAGALLDTALSLFLKSLVVSLLAAALLLLSLAILLLEATVLLFAGKDFFDKRAFAILVLDSARKILGRPLIYGTNLAVLGRVHLATFLLVVTMRVKHVTHLQQLKIPLELWCEVRAREVVPLGAGGGLLFLVTLLAIVPCYTMCESNQCGRGVSE